MLEAAPNASNGACTTQISTLSPDRKYSSTVLPVLRTRIPTCSRVGGGAASRLIRLYRAPLFRASPKRGSDVIAALIGLRDLSTSSCSAVNHLLKSVVREIRTLRSVGTGGGRPPPVTRCRGCNSSCLLTISNDVRCFTPSWRGSLPPAPYRRRFRLLPHRFFGCIALRRVDLCGVHYEIRGAQNLVLPHK